MQNLTSIQPEQGGGGRRKLCTSTRGRYMAQGTGSRQVKPMALHSKPTLYMEARSHITVNLASAAWVCCTQLCKPRHWYSSPRRALELNSTKCLLLYHGHLFTTSPPQMRFPGRNCSCVCVTCPTKVLDLSGSSEPIPPPTSEGHKSCVV